MRWGVDVKAEYIDVNPKLDGVQAQYIPAVWALSSQASVLICHLHALAQAGQRLCPADQSLQRQVWFVASVQPSWKGAYFFDNLELLVLH